MADQTDTDSDETLIAYVRGRLPRPAADRIAAEAADRPALAAEIALMRGIASAVEEEQREPSPGEFGWARLSRAIDAEAAAPARRPIWQFAASAAAAILLWQVVAMPVIGSFTGGGGYSPVSRPSDDFTLQVAFAPGASEAAIRDLLREIGAQVSGGPSAVGLWQLSFENTRARDTGLARLEAAGIVESAQTP